MSLKIYAPLITFATKHGRYLRKMDKRGIGTLSFVRASSEPDIVVIGHAHGSRFELRHLIVPGSSSAKCASKRNVSLICRRSLLSDVR